MSNSITLDTVKQIVAATIDQLQDAVSLLRDLHDDKAGKIDIANFLKRVGVATHGEDEAEIIDGQAMLAAQAIAVLQAIEPPPGISFIMWNSDARVHLASVIASMPLEYLDTIVLDHKNEHWLTAQTLKLWAEKTPTTGMIPARPPGHRERGYIMEIVAALLKELRA